MSRNQLVKEAYEAGRAAKHNLKFIRNNPNHVIPSKRKVQEDYLKMLMKFSKEEKRNARRSGRTSLRNRIKFLVLSIISHPSEGVK